jgi:hypothetical protein
MQQARSARNKALWVLACTLGLALIGVVGCTMVGDSLTGVTAHRADVTSCIKDCNDQYKVLYDQEQALHLANVNACQALSQPDKDACLAAEDARHQAAMDALNAGKTACQNNCHQQGSATAG